MQLIGEIVQIYDNDAFETDVLAAVGPPLVSSELDPKRNEFRFEHLAKLAAQCWPGLILRRSIASCMQIDPELQTAYFQSWPPRTDQAALQTLTRFQRCFIVLVRLRRHFRQQISAISID